MTTPYSVHSIVEPLSKDTPEMRALSKLCMYTLKVSSNWQSVGVLTQPY